MLEMPKSTCVAVAEPRTSHGKLTAPADGKGLVTLHIHRGTGQVVLYLDWRRCPCGIGDLRTRSERKLLTPMAVAGEGFLEPSVCFSAQ